MSFFKRTMIVFPFLALVLYVAYNFFIEKNNVWQTSVPNYLFVASAQRGHIYRDNKIGKYIIVLEKIDPWVLYFSDRPHRDMGYMRIKDFLVQMKREEKKFETRGLNAAMIIKQPDNKIIKYVFALYDPHHDGQTHSLSLQADALPNQAENILPLPPTATNLKQPVLFIDACVGCAGMP